MLAHQDLQVVGGGLHLSGSFKKAVSGGDDISLVDDGAATHEVTSLVEDEVIYIIGEYFWGVPGT